jgi:hypothetical protein
MSVTLSVNAQSYLSQIGISPQIILDIEGIDLIFGAQPILKTLVWDEDDPSALWDNELYWDGGIEDLRSRDYISLAETTNNITQQIAPDKGSTSSISTVNICLVDKDGEVSKAFSFDEATEMLGRKAIFSIGFAEGLYPEDANPVFRGVIVDFFTEAGKVVISLASPETLKRQLLLEKIQTPLTAIVNTTQTSISVESTEGLIPQGDALTTYVRINDEIMKVNSFTATSLSVTRAQLNTVPGSHEIGDTAESFYRLQGRPVDLSLKMMLSNTGNTYFNSLDIPKGIEFVSVTEAITNAIIFDYYSIQEKTGLTVGDYVQLDSALNTGTYTINEFGTLENGDSYIVVNEDLNLEEGYAGTFKYKSKWNVLPFGLNMLTSEVDVAQFESIDAFFGSSFVDFDLYVKDSIDDAKEFIDRQLFFPSGLYSIPRKARSSVKYVAPPFSSDIVPELDLDTVLNANKIRQRRSIHKYLYNTYVWRYELDSIEDKYLAGKVIVSADSVNRMNVGKKQLKIESDGLRDTSETRVMIENVGARLLDRYQFASTYFEDVEVNYKTGYTIEVGDIIPFGGEELQITNLQTGDRGSELQFYEVINKSLNVKNGRIKLSLVSTSFDVGARYAVISLASNIGSGSTATRIRIELTNDTDEWARESDKWLQYIGQTVTVRSEDYSFDQEAILAGVDSSDKNFLLLETPLSSAPLAGYIIEPSYYQDSDKELNDKFKLEFAHLVSRVTITVVNSTSSFEVDDPTKLQVGSYIIVNSDDFTRDSFGSKHKIDSIIGSTVTLDSTLDFLPLVGDVVNASNFADGGFPYLIL